MDMKKFRSADRITQIKMVLDVYLESAPKLADDLLEKTGLTEEQAAFAGAIAQQTLHKLPVTRDAMVALAFQTAKNLDEPMQPGVCYEDAWEYVRANPDLTIADCDPDALMILATGHLSELIKPFLAKVAMYYYAAGDNQLYERLEAVYEAVILWLVEDQYGIKPEWMPYFGRYRKDLDLDGSGPRMWEILFGDELLMDDDELLELSDAELTVRDLRAGEDE